MLLFESQSCSKSFCFVRAVTCPSFVCVLAPVCVCFQPLCLVGSPANTHTYAQVALRHALLSILVVLPLSGNVIFSLFSWFIFRPRRLLFLPTLPRSLLPVFTPPPLSFQSHSSQPSHCILDERHSSFFFSLSPLPTAD